MTCTACVIYSVDSKRKRKPHCFNSRKKGHLRAECNPLREEPAEDLLQLKAATKRKRRVGIRRKGKGIQSPLRKFPTKKKAKTSTKNLLKNW